MALGHRVCGDGLSSGTRFELGRHAHIARQVDAAAAGLSLGEDLARRVRQVMFTQRGRDVDAEGRALSSGCISRPALVGKSRATPSVEAWARWAAEKASLQ